MRATIRCSCGKATQDVDTPSLADLGEMVSAVMVGMHATSPHEVHGMEVEVDHGPGPQHELVIQCLRKGCEREREMRVTVPYVLVGAMTLVFHTAHEGHRLALSYDGRHWESPAEP